MSLRYNLKPVCFLCCSFVDPIHTEDYPECIHDFFVSFFSGSIDGNNQLIIKGRFQQKQIENVLRRYISKCEVYFCISTNKTKFNISKSLGFEVVKS